MKIYFLTRHTLPHSLCKYTYIPPPLEVFAYNLKTARAQKMKSKWNRKSNERYKERVQCREDGEWILLPVNASCLCHWVFWLGFSCWLHVYICMCVCARVLVSLYRWNFITKSVGSFFFCFFLRSHFLALLRLGFYTLLCTFYSLSCSISSFFFAEPSKYCNLAFVKWVLVRDNPMLLYEAYRMNEWVAGWKSRYFECSSSHMLTIQICCEW